MTTTFPILDLILGLVFIFFLLSIITSSAVELALSFFRLRARELKVWLYTVMDKPALNAEGYYYDQAGKCYTKSDGNEYVQVSPDGLQQGEAQSLLSGATFRQTGGRAYNVKMIAPPPGQRAADATRTPGKMSTPKQQIKLVSLGQSIMDHCAATVLSQKGKSPTYIDARTFVSAFLEKVTMDPNSPGSIPEDIHEFQKALQASPLLSHELKRTMLMLLNEAKDEARQAGTALIHFRAKLQSWYDATTDRISGDLKRKWALPFTILVSIVVTMGLNADTIVISKYLYTHKEARTALANTATSAIDTQKYDQRVAALNEELNRRLQQNPQDTGAASGLKQLKEASENFRNSIADFKTQMPEGLPLGNDKTRLESYGHYAMRHLPGWLFSIFAICMGAPFWFDLLNKVANLRGTGPKPPSTTDAERKLAGTDKK